MSTVTSLVEGPNHVEMRGQVCFVFATQKKRVVFFERKKKKLFFIE